MSVTSAEAESPLDGCICIIGIKSPNDNAWEMQSQVLVHKDDSIAITK
jgi:hypothetical protein